MRNLPQHSGMLYIVDINLGRNTFVYFSELYIFLMKGHFRKISDFKF